MDDFVTLVTHCKAGVTLTVNDHRNNYQGVDDYLDGVGCVNEDLDDLSAEVRREMVKSDTIVHLQFYPDTPVGSYSIYHYSVTEAVREALGILLKR